MQFAVFIRKETNSKIRAQKSKFVVGLGISPSLSGSLSDPKESTMPSPLLYPTPRELAFAYKREIEGDRCNIGASKLGKNVLKRYFDVS